LPQIPFFWRSHRKASIHNLDEKLYQIVKKSEKIDVWSPCSNWVNSKPGNSAVLRLTFRGRVALFLMR
jgi:hypothetical protein